MYWERTTLYGTIPARVRCPSTPDEFKRCTRAHMIMVPGKIHIRQYIKIRRDPAAVKAWVLSQPRSVT